MNRRIGRLIQIGLFAALPIGWTSVAAAQNVNPGTTNDVPSVSGNGINPSPQGDLDTSKSSDQLKANQMDSTSPTPLAGSQQQGSDINQNLNTPPSDQSNLQDKSNSMGSSTLGQKNKDLDQSSSVPGSVDTNDIQRSSGTDLDKQGDQQLEQKSNSDQLGSDTDLNKSNDTTTKKSKHHARSSKSSRSSESIENDSTLQNPSVDQKSNDNLKNDNLNLKNDSDINK